MNWGSEIRDSQSFETHLKRPRDLAGSRYKMLEMISGGILIVSSYAIGDFNLTEVVSDLRKKYQRFDDEWHAQHKDNKI